MKDDDKAIPMAAPKAIVPKAAAPKVVTTSVVDALGEAKEKDRLVSVWKSTLDRLIAAEAELSALKKKA